MDSRVYSALMNENKNIFINGNLERMFYFRIFDVFGCHHVYVPESLLDDFLSKYPYCLPKQLRKIRQ